MYHCEDGGFWVGLTGTREGEGADWIGKNEVEEAARDGAARDSVCWADLIDWAIVEDPLDEQMSMMVEVDF